MRRQQHPEAGGVDEAHGGEVHDGRRRVGEQRPAAPGEAAPTPTSPTTASVVVLDGAGAERVWFVGAHRKGRTGASNVMPPARSPERVAYITPKGVVTVSVWDRDHRPVRLAIVDDYEVVLVGLAHMFDSYRDRIDVVETDAGDADHPRRRHRPVRHVRPGRSRRRLTRRADRQPARRQGRGLHLELPAPLVDHALRRGAAGYLSKTLTAAELVDALERIHDGEVVVSPVVPRGTVGLDWPGREEGLTERESEIVALITQGFSNAEIARLTYLSVNSIKSHIRNAYRKIGVSTRSRAVLWGVDHGFKIDHHNIDDWR